MEKCFWQTQEQLYGINILWLKLFLREKVNLSVWESWLDPLFQEFNNIKTTSQAYYTNWCLFGIKCMRQMKVQCIITILWILEHNRSGCFKLVYISIVTNLYPNLNVKSRLLNRFSLCCWPGLTEQHQRDYRVKSGCDGDKISQIHQEGRSQVLMSLCYHCGVTQAGRPSFLMVEIKGLITHWVAPTFTPFKDLGNIWSLYFYFYLKWIPVTKYFFVTSIAWDKLLKIINLTTQLTCKRTKDFICCCILQSQLAGDFLQSQPVVGLQQPWQTDNNSFPQSSWGSEILQYDVHKLESIKKMIFWLKIYNWIGLLSNMN